MRFLPKPLHASALILSALACGALRADDWPQWRGPNRDAVCAESGLMVTFPAGGLPVRWRAPVGWGWASPVVAKGKVYLADAEVKRPQPKERLHCYDEATGKELWTHTYDAAYPDWAYDPAQESGPVATPVVQDGKVYTVGRLGQMFCLDALTGNVVWQKDLGREFEVAMAPGTPSPLIEGDLLIHFAGGKRGACVVAFQRNTGQEAWKALDEAPTFSSPIVIPSGGKRQLIVWTQESVTSLDPLTGTVFWRERLITGSDYAVSTPVFLNGRLLIGGMMFQLNPDKPAAAVLWPDTKARERRIFSHTSTAMFHGEHVFSAKSAGGLICVEAATGKQLWETAKVTDLKNGASIHLTPNGDSVLLFTDRGELIRARLTAMGYDEISRTPLLSPTFPFGGRNVAWSAPAYANRHIFVRSGKELICASLEAKP